MVLLQMSQILSGYFKLVDHCRKAMLNSFMLKVSIIKLRGYPAGSWQFLLFSSEEFLLFSFCQNMDIKEADRGNIVIDGAAESA